MRSWWLSFDQCVDRLAWTVGFLILLCVASPAEAAGLRAGAATVDVTPPVGLPLWGYAARHDAPSVGVHDPLRARALVLEAGSETIALVSLDLGRPPTKQSFATIRAAVKAACGIEHLLLVASHTHHGPVLEVDRLPTPETSYVRRLERQLIELIRAADKSKRPARFGVAKGITELNRNRHSHLPDSPVDRELLVLRVEDLAGKPIALAVNFAAHPTMRSAALMKYSADYPGVMADMVERDLGVPCLFLQGAAGDLSPNANGRSPEAFGEALAREVLGLAKTVRCTDTPTTLAVREESFTFPSRLDLGNPLTRLVFSAAFFKELVEFYVQEYRDGVRPHLTTVLLAGRFGFVGVSGEFFSGHAISLKRRARLEQLFFLGYCNDYQQYFPTIEASAEGGYGTEPVVSPAALGAGERVMDEALIGLYRLRGKWVGK